MLRLLQLGRFAMETMHIEAKNIRPGDTLLTPNADNPNVIYADVVVDVWVGLVLPFIYASFESSNSLQFPPTQLVTVIRKA